MKQLNIPVNIHIHDNVYAMRFEVMKIYSVLEAVKNLLASGVIKDGITLIDSSSGIYAYSLALACHQHNLKCHLIVSKSVDNVLLLQLKLLGAKVEQIKSSNNLKQDQNKRVQRIQEILKTNPNKYYWMQQYHDDIHYNAYIKIAEQIVNEFNSTEINIVGGIGSGSCTGGIAKGLIKLNIKSKIIGVQPFGSITFGSDFIENHEIIIAGIGSAIPFRNVKHSYYDRIHWISFQYGKIATIELFRNTGIFAGLSSGCNYLVSLYEAKKYSLIPIIFVVADMGFRYVADVYDDDINISLLKPKEISCTEELALPWCAINWNRKNLS